MNQDFINSDFDFNDVEIIDNSHAFDIRDLSAEVHEECKNVALERVRQQVEDAAKGDVRATYTRGGSGDMGRRHLSLREEDSFMGTLSEKIISIKLKCVWTKEMGQYKSNPNPDLLPAFRGLPIDCAVRSSRQLDLAICRLHQDIYKDKNSILVAITNFPQGPLCRIGWISFGELVKLAEANPSWKVEPSEEAKKSGDKPFYWIPFKYFSQDFSEFGK